MAFKHSANEIECGGISLKSYIDKKINNLYNRSMQQMPFVTFIRFADAQSITPEPNVFTQIPLTANTITSDGEIFEVNQSGELEFKGNGNRMLSLDFSICAAVPTHLAALTRFQVKIERIASDGTSVLSTYKQYQLPLDSTNYSQQFTIPVTYRGGVDEGDKFVLKFSVNQSNIETVWQKMDMLAICKYPIENDFIETSF